MCITGPLDWLLQSAVLLSSDLERRQERLWHGQKGANIFAFFAFMTGAGRAVPQ